MKAWATCTPSPIEFFLEERQVLPAATRVTFLTSDQLLVCDPLQGIPAYMEQSLASMIIDLNARSSGTDSHLSALLERRRH